MHHAPTSHLSVQAAAVGSCLVAAVVLGNSAVVAERDNSEAVAAVVGRDNSDADGVCAELIAAGHEVQEIGRLVDEPGITLVHPDGRQTREQPRGFDHFLT